MKMRGWGQSLLSLLKENFLALGLFLGVFVIFIYGLNDAQEGSRQEALHIVEESISRSIVTCYAIEGSYPDSLDYLETYYGLAVDEDKYYVDYQIFASNIMPQVTVIEVGT